MGKNRKTSVLYISPFSPKAFGAEEQDLEAGLMQLRSETSFEVFSLKVNLFTQELIINFDYNLIKYPKNYLNSIRYALRYFGSPDNTLRQAYTFENFLTIQRIVKELDIDVIFTNTTSTLLFGKISGVKHVHRSVGFEPIYVLKSVDNKLKSTFHSAVKIFTVLSEMKSNLLFAISPRDAQYYNRFGRILRKQTQIEVLPLRQFSLRTNHSMRNQLPETLNIAFLGSTYNVLHNRRSLEYLLEVFNEEFLLQNQSVFNVYGRKIPQITLRNISNSRVRVNNWIEDLQSIYDGNQIFVVPNFLSSGMQSKVFEPLTFGKILICSPEVLSGYNFTPKKHYLPATKTAEFRECLEWINNNRNESIKIGLEASMQSQKIFGKQFKESIIGNILK